MTTLIILTIIGFSLIGAALRGLHNKKLNNETSTLQLQLYKNMLSGNRVSRTKHAL